ncbi:peptidoglycan binding domain-containing protein [Kitasatospora sp. NBC_01250]|uniref:peptidoglycan binding domain-containing protein n=1 Tax=Kitasatospora sp. NBC_01250 TaxID=2903571 RepID=UPI002E33BB08|nr:peptidoglycan binding domain-containing protein [Kitasatospora sp. NBC_01250]
MSSRESDSAYPSSRRATPPGHRAGEGLDAYPSGTPPYGIPGLANGFGGDPFGSPSPAAHEETEPEVPKTETTLTTRISINIPGSRPIPPVVMRSTVKPEEQAAEPEAGARRRPAAPAAPGAGPEPTPAPDWRTPPGGTPVPGGAQAPAGAQQGESEAESTGEWFRPRQKSRPEPVGSTAPRAAAPSPAPSVGAPAAAPTGAPTAPQGQTPYPQGGAPAAPLFSAESTLQTPLPRPAGTPPSPFGGGEFAGNEFGGGGFGGGVPQQPATGSPYSDQPYQHTGGTSYPGADQSYAPGSPYANAGPYPGDPYQGRPEGPAASFPGAADPQPGLGTPPPAADPFGTTANPRPTGTPGAPGRFAKPQPPVNPPGAFGRRAPGSEEPEDTQIGGFDPISGELPEEAIPGLPVAGVYGAAPAAPRPGGAATAAGAPRSATEPPAPGAPVPAPLGTEPLGGAEAAPAAAPPKKQAAAKPKARSKVQKLLVTGVGGVLFLGAAAYGTGLMLNQADVPRGTTVLGTDIGGDSRDQAVHQLDGTVGQIGAKPIQLKLGDQTLPLDPATAGLSFDTTATVDGLTKHSYGPMTVIGSLAGGTKKVPPAMRIDRAKLKAALDSLAASSAHGLKEGYVQFSDTGDPTVVPGQAGQAVDGNSAVDQVVQSYQDRANGKADAPVTLAVTAAQPKVSTQALQQAADGLGKAIVSGRVTVLAGTGSATRKFVFTKAIAAKTLTLVPDGNGNFVPKWDLNQLATAVGPVFDKLKFRKSDGTLAPITTQDVADAIASVYDKNTDAERTSKFHM